MEPWIVYICISTLLIGIAEFFSKVVAHKKINGKKVVFYSKFPSLILSIIYFLYTSNFELLTWFLIIIALVRIIFANNKNIFRIESLKHIDTTIFYPATKVLQIFITFIVGMLLFNEFLVLKEYIALLLGIVIIFLLLNKYEFRIQKNFRLGVLFLFLFSFSLMFSSSINKYISSNGYDLGIYLLISSFWEILYTYFIASKFKGKKKYYVKNRFAEIKYGLIIGVFSFLSFLILLFSLRTGEFVLVHLIRSFSIFIPMLLSVLIYKETLGFRKIVALVLLIIFLFLII